MNDTLVKMQKQAKETLKVLLPQQKYKYSLILIEYRHTNRSSCEYESDMFHSNNLSAFCSIKYLLHYFLLKVNLNLPDPDFYHVPLLFMHHLPES